MPNQTAAANFRYRQARRRRRRFIDLQPPVPNRIEACPVLPVAAALAEYATAQEQERLGRVHLSEATTNLSAVCHLLVGRYVRLSQVYVGPGDHYLDGRLITSRTWAPLTVVGRVLQVAAGALDTRNANSVWITVRNVVTGDILSVRLEDDSQIEEVRVYWVDENGGRSRSEPGHHLPKDHVGPLRTYGD
jgi:hypothetical protein